jgi:hypothetical protein
MAAAAAEDYAIVAAADDGMTVEEVVELAPAEAVADVIADAVEIGIIAGETGEESVATEEESSVIVVEEALLEA